MLTINFAASKMWKTTSKTNCGKHLMALQLAIFIASQGKHRELAIDAISFGSIVQRISHSSKIVEKVLVWQGL